MSKSAVPPPMVGQCFLDEQEVHWTVKNLILSDSLEDFFLASLSHGRTSECKEGTIVVSQLEFEALCRTRGMKVTYVPPRPVQRINGESELAPIAVKPAGTSEADAIQ